MDNIYIGKSVGNASRDESVGKSLNSSKKMLIGGNAGNGDGGNFTKDFT